MNFILFSVSNDDNLLASTHFENTILKDKCSKMAMELAHVKKQLKEQQANLNDGISFSAKIQNDEDFKYYTGFSLVQFDEFFSSLLPDKSSFTHSEKRESFQHISFSDQLLMVLIQLRKDFDFVHLGHLFLLSPCDCSVIFSDWINFIFNRIGQTNVPHRDIILRQMPDKLKMMY